MTDMSRIYLAGPISHLTYEETSSWRNKVIAALEDEGFWFLNPVLDSDVDHVNKNTGVFGNGHDLNENISDMFFVRDMKWVKDADITLADFTIVPKTLGGGTPYELGAAFAWNKTVIVVGPKENIPLFCLKGASIHFDTIDEAIEFLKTV